MDDQREHLEGYGRCREMFKLATSGDVQVEVLLAKTYVELPKPAVKERILTQERTYRVIYVRKTISKDKEVVERNTERNYVVAVKLLIGQIPRARE